MSDAGRDIQGDPAERPQPVTARRAERRFTFAPGDALFRLAAIVGQLWLAIGATFEREMEARRGFLWLPVVFGIGDLAYFTLPREPSVLALAPTLAILATTTVLRRHHTASFRLLLVLSVILAGLVAAKVRTDAAIAPVLSRDLTATVTGWVAAEEESPNAGRRVVVRVASIAGVPSSGLPWNARITIRSKAAALTVGDAISVKARLGPPGGPVEPGGYEFAFVPFYQGIGAVGFAFGAASAAELGPAPLALRVERPLGQLRDLLRARIEEALPGDYGHIAAALIMGDQRGIAASTQNAMRASGLGHILSISGLHMALVAGSVFWLIRALLALSPMLALNYPIKKWAAAAALVVATFYLGISGSEVATVRSYVMLAIMLGSVLIDRRALTLRNVALSALVILLFSPDSLLSISFQMSFAATVALIAAYEALASRSARLASDTAPIVRRLREKMTTLFITALIAGLATAPFAAYYFQRLAPLTLVANMAAEPAIGLVVMPMALLAVVAMPFGLEVFPLTVMKWGLQWMVAVATQTTAWSAGIGNFPALSASALLLMTAGALWLALWNQRWRLAGVVPIVIALPLAILASRPEILVDDAGDAVAVRGDDGRLAIMGGAGFDVQNWLRADGDPRAPDAADISRGVSCDDLGCIVSGADGREVAYVKRSEAFDEDCRTAAVIVSPLTAPPGCDRTAIVIDRTALARFGAHALYPNGGSLRVETAYPAIRRPFMPPARSP